MSHLKLWMILGAVVASIWMIPNAEATLFQTSYTLNVDYCTTGCLFGGTGGTVTLSDLGTVMGIGTVGVNVVVQPNLNFHDAGLTTFGFNLAGVAGTSVSISTSGFTQVFSSNFDGAGDFDFALNCSACGPSQNDIHINTLSFTVSGAGLVTDSFHELSAGGSPSAYFAVNVYSLVDGACTGIIGANGSSTPTTGGSNTGTGACGAPVVPEPGTLLLLGSGLVGLAIIGWRRNRA